MATKCEDLSLHEILESFNACLNEEQVWALAYLALNNPSIEDLITEENVCVRADGSLHVKRLNHEWRASRAQILSSLGVLLFKALDFGLKADEERSLSPDLEILIEGLTSVDSNQETTDEGIERDVSYDSFEDFLQRCESRLETNAETHYRTVLRNLFIECLELKTFLSQIQEEKREISQHTETPDSDWARNWCSVVRQLREGVTLRRSLEKRSPKEYSKTPFESLLEDIRSKRYKLNSIGNDGNPPARPTKDTHSEILDFIRSKPHLNPVKERQLKPLPPRERSLYESLMIAIRSRDHKLKPIESSQESSSSRETFSHTSRTPQPKRRLIKADLNLELEEEFERERRHSLSSLDTRIDASEDARSHVEDIWRETDFGRALQTLSLTLQEVRHIREVLTRAELETLAVTQEMRSDLENQKICFNCLKTRFTLFKRRKLCSVCLRAVCQKCETSLRVPSLSLEKIPLFMLSPSSSPTETSREEHSTVKVCSDCKRLIRHLVDAGTARAHYL